MTDCIVTPNALGGWDVQLAGARESAQRTSSRAAAESAAQRLVGREGGTVVVLDARGRELARQTVLPDAVPTTAKKATASAVTRLGPEPVPPPIPTAAPAPTQRRSRPPVAAPHVAPLPRDDVDALVDDLIIGYREARAAALQADGATRGLIIRDLVRSADNALSKVNLHSGEHSAAAQRLSRFLDDLRREDWVKTAMRVTSAGVSAVGLDYLTLLGAAVAGAVSGFIFVMAAAANAFVIVAGAGGALLLVRTMQVSAEALEGFFTKEMPGAGLVSKHVDMREKRLLAVTGGRSPLLRVSDASGQAVKVGVGLFVAAVVLGAVLGAASLGGGAAAS